MKRRTAIWTMLVLLCLCPAALISLLAHARAENTTTAFRIQGLGQGCKVSVVGATQGDVVASVTTVAASKVAHVVRFEAGGSTMFVLLRVEASGNGLFIDGIAAATTAALATAIDGFNLSGINHPHPTKDTADNYAKTNLTGYTGS